MIGAALFAAMAGLYAAAPVVFAADVRTTGLGWAIGIGRVGAILSPLTVGVLVDRHWQPAALYVLCALPLLLAAWACLGLRVGVGQKGAEPHAPRMSCNVRLSNHMAEYRIDRAR